MREDLEKRSAEKRASLARTYRTAASGEERFARAMGAAAYLARNGGSVELDGAPAEAGTWYGRAFEDATTDDQRFDCAQEIDRYLVASGERVPYQGVPRGRGFWKPKCLELATNEKDYNRVLLELNRYARGVGFGDDEEIFLEGRRVTVLGLLGFVYAGLPMRADRVEVAREICRRLMEGGGTAPLRGREEGECAWLSELFAASLGVRGCEPALTMIYEHFLTSDEPVRDGAVLGGRAYWLGREYELGCGPWRRRNDFHCDGILAYLDEHGGTVPLRGEELDHRQWLAQILRDARTGRSRLNAIGAACDYLEANGGTLSLGGEERDERGWLEVLARESVTGYALRITADRVCGFLAREGGEVSGHDLAWWQAHARGRSVAQFARTRY